jgi:hypothetical protein
MAQTEPKVAKIALDQDTRSRIATELGLQAGADAIPEEIEFVGVAPTDAGLDPEPPDVQGFALYAPLRTDYFVNSSVTPSLSTTSLNSLRLSPSSLKLVMVI